MKFNWILICVPLLVIGCMGSPAIEAKASEESARQVVATKEVKQVKDFPVQKTDEEWKKELTAEQYHILREKGTDRPFTGKYWNFNEKGDYLCAACGEPLFKSDTKFDAGCGWPSFYEAIGDGKVVLKEDRSLGMVRTEVLCGKCGGHLGHVFDDGPEPTGKRFCINSTSIEFKGSDHSTSGGQHAVEATHK